MYTYTHSIWAQCETSCDSNKFSGRATVTRDGVAKAGCREGDHGDSYSLGN